MRPKPWSTRLRKKAKVRGSGGAIGTIAFYGPDNRHASKVAVGILPEGAEEVSLMERWHEGSLDVRIDPEIGRKVVAFLREHRVRQVAVAEGIIGCPPRRGCRLSRR